MRTAIYIRVSTEEQATEGYSISAQNQRLKAYCIAQDWDVAGFYVDEGISAKNMKRPKLQEMIQDIKDGKIDCVLVYRLDRLTRSVLDLYQLLALFDEHNCKFKSATEVYDTTTAMGRLFITIVGALAQWERENMGERIRMGFQEKVRQGKYAQNFSPYGYDLDLETGTLTINEDEGEIVRLMNELYLKGLGANRICRYLNDKGITTKGGNMWNDKPVMEILKNPLYMGTIRWNKDFDTPLMVKNSVPPIIDAATFESVQKTIEKRRSQSPKQISSDYIFSGAIKCPNCESSMVGYPVYYKNPKGETTIYKNYRCLRKKTGQCFGSKSISEKALEREFIAYMNDFDFKKEIPQVAEPTIYQDGEDVDRDHLNKELEQIEKRKKKWQYAWANDIISDDEFNNRMNEERTLETDINAKLDSVTIPTATKVNYEEMQTLLKEIEGNWNALDRIEKKNFIQSLVKTITVDYDNKKLYVKNVDFG